MTYTVKKLNNFEVGKNTVILKGWGVIAEDGTLARSSTGDCGYEVYNTKAIAQRVADFKNNKKDQVQVTQKMTNIEKCLNGADALKPIPKRTIMLKSVINGELRITEVETVTDQLLPQMQAVANKIFGVNNWAERLGWSYSANKNNYGYEITNCAGSFLWVAYEQ